MREKQLNAQAPPENETPPAISAMPMHIRYAAKIGQVSLTKQDDEYLFHLASDYRDEKGRRGERWDKREWNAYALRAAFEAVKTETDALEFLSGAGWFLPSPHPLSWSTFQAWQRFVKIVRQENKLQALMSEVMSGKDGMAVLARGGDELEVLKALGGYPNAFFTGTLRRPDPTTRSLCEWFYRPPQGALSIEWLPLKDEPELLSKVQKGGALMEFFRGAYGMRPVLRIEAECALQAIAATVYADRVGGVEWNKCEICNRLFKLESGQHKRYCSQTCKDTARQRRRADKVNERNRNKRAARKLVVAKQKTKHTA
jgi:hypothetical protein